MTPASRKRCFTVGASPGSQVSWLWAKAAPSGAEGCSRIGTAVSRAKPVLAVLVPFLVGQNGVLAEQRLVPDVPRAHREAPPVGAEDAVEALELDHEPLALRPCPQRADDGAGIGRRGLERGEGLGRAVERAHEPSLEDVVKAHRLLQTAIPEGHGVRAASLNSTQVCKIVSPSIRSPAWAKNRATASELLWASSSMKRS